jgi:hypothetical protein
MIVGGAIGGMNDGQGKPKYSEKTCSNAALLPPEPTGLEPDSNPRRRGGKPAAIRLSYSTAA